jgi:hypothetical protein
MGKFKMFRTMAGVVAALAGSTVAADVPSSAPKGVAAPAPMVVQFSYHIGLTAPMVGPYDGVVVEVPYTAFADYTEVTATISYTLAGKAGTQTVTFGSPNVLVEYGNTLFPGGSAATWVQITDTAALPALTITSIQVSATSGPVTSSKSVVTPEAGVVY